MLISPVADEEYEKRKVRGDSSPVAGHSHEYRTASELFDLMASKHTCRSETPENETLTTRDLVFIYKNIDLGTKLMSDAKESKKKPPNQYVETIVYDDLDSDSDLSEICSYEDIHNVMLINNERIDLLTRSSSFENTICHKFGGIDLCTSDLSVEYDRKCLYANPYLQFNPIKMDTKKNGNTALSVSPLLDYICCKRLEDNYNFDMDNVIRYVKHTIDQLKRISNGDYLTEKVKEKWREVDNNAQIKQGEVIEAKVLSNKTSIPLYVERRLTGSTTKWDDLVHSSVDIRSLSKILEKKIIVEVPKTLCGSYTLFSRCCDDNLVIRCQKDLPSIAPKETSLGSQVDVVVHLNRSQSGNVISNINTIMILRKPEPTDLLPLLAYESSEKITSSEEKVIEIDMHDDNQVCANDNADNINQNLVTCSNTGSPSIHRSSEYLSPFDTGDSGYNSSGLPNNMYGNYGDRFKKFASGLGSPVNCLPFDELRQNLQKLNMTSLPEESNEGNSSIYNKRGSPTRNRIKSPYENKSHLAEEKKRKKLLEVRQRRENRKIALSVAGSKVKKLKYPIPPQTANSVTKLSISNKSFYNSIYGQSANMESKPSRTKVRKETSDSIPEVSSDVELSNSIISPDMRDMHSQKYINKSYYLDNAVTEMMYIDKQKSEAEESYSEIMSTTANDIKMELRLLSHLITPSVITLPVPELGNENNVPRHTDNNFDDDKSKTEVKILPPSIEHPETPNNSPLSTQVNTSEQEADERDHKKASTSSEFIKSIDKIYELIHKLGKAECNETKLCKSKFTAVAERYNYNDVAGASSTVQCSDSGTSVKHQLTSSNPSCYSFEKSCKVEQSPTSESPNKKNVPAANVVPKVIISTKAQNAKGSGEKSKRDYRRFTTNRQNTPQNDTESPLKAITQLLQNFDNVQKIRSKTATEKMSRKPEVSFADTKAENRNVTNKKAPKMEHRFEQHLEKQIKFPKDRKVKSPQQLLLAETRPGSRALKKNVVDIVDEMKEARGEAVRGPCKLNARLNSLAQPKKTYVQAQIEEFHARFGKSIITDRLQRMSASHTGQSVELPKYASSKLRRKKDSPERLSTSKSLSNAHPAVLEKSQKQSPIRNKLDIRVPNDLCSKQSNAFVRETSKKKLTLSLHCPDQLSSIPNSDESNRSGKLRAPYIPNDLETGSIVSSMEESSAIRSNIHQIINVIIPNTEVRNANVNSNVDENIEKDVPNKNPKQKPTFERNSSDYQQDRTVRMKCEYMIGDTIPETNDTSQDNEENPVPVMETSKVLQCHRNIAFGSIQKRIYHKPLTLTPKESMQQVLLLQSGDSNSVILQSTTSQNIFTKNKEPELKYYQMLTSLDWNFAQFPVQMPIIGYSIPKYIKPRPAQTEVHNSDQNTFNINKTTQCFKGTHVEQFSNHAIHVDIKDVLTLSSLMKLGSTVIEEEPEEIIADVIPEQTQEVVKIKSLTDISDVGNLGKKNDISKDDEKVIFDREYEDTPSQKCINTLSVNEISSSSMSNTTSLDVLVGLLNEIQNITSCQSQMASSDADDTGIHCEEMQAILENAAALQNVEQEARNIISITSLDKLRKLESNASILSFYLSNHGDKDTVGNSFENLEITPLYADKGVSVIMPTAYVNKCTSIPSQFFPITVNHSTNVSNSLIGVLSEPSSHSILTFNEQPLRSNRSLTCLTNLFELQKNIPEDKSDQLPVVITSKHVEIDSYRKVNTNKSKLTKNLDQYKFIKKEFHTKHSADSDFDPVLKMKRDILVTMYSVLVLTIFAALSFPDILYSA